MSTVSPRRIQLRRTKGWRKPPVAVVVSRPSIFSNPFKVSVFGAGGAVRLFRLMLDHKWAELERAMRVAAPQQSEARVVFDLVAIQMIAHRIDKNMHLLRGKDLACWCGLDAKCHADVLLEAANRAAVAHA